MPEELISRYHHPLHQTMDRRQRHCLGLLETVSFLSINIHGERVLAADLEQRPYRDRRIWDGLAAGRSLQLHPRGKQPPDMRAGFRHRDHGKVLPDAAIAVDNSSLSPLAEHLPCFGRTYALEGFLSFMNLSAGSRCRHGRPEAEMIVRP